MRFLRGTKDRNWCSFSYLSTLDEFVAVLRVGGDGGGHGRPGHDQVSAALPAGQVQVHDAHRAPATLAHPRVTAFFGLSHAYSRILVRVSKVCQNLLWHPQSSSFFSLKQPWHSPNFRLTVFFLSSNTHFPLLTFFVDSILVIETLEANKDANFFFTLRGFLPSIEGRVYQVVIEISSLYSSRLIILPRRSLQNLFLRLIQSLPVCKLHSGVHHSGFFFLEKTETSAVVCAAPDFCLPFNFLPCAA